MAVPSSTPSSASRPVTPTRARQSRSCSAASIGERPEECARANPVTRVGSGAPPLLILHGQADPYVPHHQSELLFAAAAAHAATATFYSIPHARHEHGYLSDPAQSAGFLVREASAGAERRVPDAPPPTWNAIEAFIRDPRSPAERGPRPSRSAPAQDLPIGRGPAGAQPTLSDDPRPPRTGSLGAVLRMPCATHGSCHRGLPTADANRCLRRVPRGPRTDSDTRFT